MLSRRTAEAIRIDNRFSPHRSVRPLQTHQNKLYRYNIEPFLNLASKLLHTENRPD